MVEVMFLENKTDHKLSTIWGIEYVGNNSKEREIYQNFENDLEFTGERYSVTLPFKLTNELAPDNFILSKKRLSSLKQKLDCNSTRQFYSLEKTFIKFKTEIRL